MTTIHEVSALSHYAGLALIFIGAIFMVFAIVKTYRTTSVVSERQSHRWLTLAVFMVFFLIGYTVVWIVQFLNLDFPYQIFISLIFCFGGAFVFIVIGLSKENIIELNGNAEALAGINKNLDALVLEKTARLENQRQELIKQNVDLESAYTELKEAQAQILRQEKMASIGQLAAGVAHEINNPMGFITSNLRTLSKYTKNLIESIDEISSALKDEEDKDFVKEIKKRKKLKYISSDSEDLIEESLEGAERVSDIVKNLKTFSRVDQKEIQLVDLNECLESAVKVVWNEIKYKAEITKEFGEIPQLNCYPCELGQVFLNMIMNANQAIETHGSITLSTKELPDAIMISIADSGKGISKEDISRIFEPFFTTKDVGQGTGLGLSICYEIIKKHHGDIEVHSKVGEGTRFDIVLPKKGIEAEEL